MIQYTTEYPTTFSCGFFHRFPEFKLGTYDYQPSQIDILLPKEYFDTEARYPVIYMNDGQAIFLQLTDSDTEEAWGIGHAGLKLF